MVKKKRKTCAECKHPEYPLSLINKKEDKFPIPVTESGLHICVDDILNEDDAVELIRAVKKALHEYRELNK